MPQVTATDGTPLHYELHGHGLRSLLLLHGMGTSDTWRPLLQHLNLDTWRVLTFDWRGHGRSGGAAGFTYPQLQRDVLTVLDAAKFPTCIVVGFSGSCKNAVWLAAEAPKRVIGLVLVASCGFDVVPLPRDTIIYFAEYLEQKKDVPPEFATWFTNKIGAEKAAVVNSLASIPRPVLEASAELWIYTSIVGHAARVTQRVKVIAAARDFIYHTEYQGRPRSCHCHTEKWKSWTAAISFPLKSPPLLQAC
jgi:pimeloyl-ACP methyl ester carboxylesterase